MRLEMCKTMAKALLASSVLVSPPSAHINHVTAITVCGSDALFVLSRLSRRTTHTMTRACSQERQRILWISTSLTTSLPISIDQRSLCEARVVGGLKAMQGIRLYKFKCGCLHVSMLACACACACACARARSDLSLSLSFPPSLPSDLSQTCLTAPCIGLLGAAAVKPRRGGPASDAEIQPRRRSRHASARCGSPC